MTPNARALRFVQQTLGLAVTEPELARALRQRARERRQRADEYERTLVADPAERGALASLLTTPETYFFRERLHLDVLVTEAMPALGPVPRILSVGCASGEEPYSVVLALEAAGWDRFQITAIDASRRAIERARAATYSEWALRATPDEVRRSAFHRVGSGWVLDRRVRERVSFHEASLFDEDPRLFSPASADVVFCRNVVMYFDAEPLRAAVEKLARVLAPGGWLFLGHAESLRTVPGALAPAGPFEVVESKGAFFYRRRSTTSPSHEAPARASAVSPRAPDVAPPPEASAPVREDPVLPPLPDRAPSAPREAAPPAAPGPGPALPDELQLASRRVHTGALAEAEALARRHLASEQWAATAHYLVAVCRDAAGDHTAAAAHHRAAITLRPGFGLAHFALGLLSLRAGDRAEARERLSTAARELLREPDAPVELLADGFGRAALLDACNAALRACEGGDRA